ncbi:MAG: dTMP kinase [Alphaproteobacteria bacterium]|nr:dTMP kinase [Alphaproteobacteria bacterium]
MSSRGRFITLEGGEGSGKSTLARRLKDALEARGRNVRLTREPGGTPAAEALRSMILSPPDGVTFTPLVEALLFYAARRDHLERLIRPELSTGVWVISDRFSDSTRAYQAAAGGALGEEIEALERLCVGSSGPDLTLILDLPLDAAGGRVRARGAGLDAIEGRGEAYHARVREAFLEIAQREPQRCVVLDASLPPEALCDQALAVIDQRLGAP